MKKAVMIIAFTRFQEKEYEPPKEILEKAGLQVTTASSKPGYATGKAGGRAKVDITLDQVKVMDYDAVVFVGGPGSWDYHHDPKAHRIAQEAIKEEKILAAICAAPPILGYAGVLKGKKATMFEDTGDLKKAGCTYTGSDVEIDGNIITATGPDTAIAWAEAIVKALK